jgi:mxaA protein
LRYCRGHWVVFLLLFSLGADGSLPAQEPARKFGYFIGDVIEQPVHLQIENRKIELTDIPPNQRVGLWLERLSSTLISVDRDQDWLVMRYQIINAPSELTAISLPAMSLTAIDGEPLLVDARQITISPLLPAVISASGMLPIMRPDRPPAPADWRSIARPLKSTSIALGATLVCWLGWWLWRRHTDAVRLPFARALHEMRRLDLEQLDENPHAWFALHHAFNEAAGRAVNSGTIAELIEQQPWLKSMQTRIESFYAASVERFFEQAPQPQAFALFEFGKSLYQTEKQHSDGRSQPNLH